MQVFELNKVNQPFEKAAVTIGNFDGVHIGHQALFHQVMEKADAMGGTSLAMTFDPHPLRFLKKKDRPPLITLHEQKVELIEKSGLDALVVIPFDENFAAMEARPFIEEILVNKLGVKALIVGPDYSFGKNRQGTVEALKQWAPELGFQVHVIPWIEALSPDGQRISSTRIRRLVSAGEMEKAQKLLGRHYQIRGTVERGRDRGGKQLGFPTANIRLVDELCPATGVYAVTMLWQGKTWPGVANLGYSPTFDDHLFTVEVHILDFEGDLYDEKIKVNFIHRLRGEIKFSGIEALARQIQNDIEQAREILRPMI